MQIPDILAQRAPGGAPPPLYLQLQVQFLEKIDVTCLCSSCYRLAHHLQELRRICNYCRKTFLGGMPWKYSRKEKAVELECENARPGVKWV